MKAFATSFQVNFRNGFYAGLIVMLIVGVYLIRLWQPERQIDLHTRHLLAQIEKKNWKAVGEFIGSDYQDRWGNDRPLLLERLREVFRAIPNAHIEVSGTMFHADHGRGHWIAKITINGAGEFADLIEARVNSLDAPFEFEWQQGVTWPWDWKLVAVRNPALEISGYGVSYFPSELRSSVLAASTSRGVAWQRRSARNFSPW